MTNYIKKLQDAYNEMGNQLNEVQKKIEDLNKQIDEQVRNANAIRGQMAGIEIAAGTYNDMMADGTCQEEYEDVEPCVSPESANSESEG